MRVETVIPLSDWRSVAAAARAAEQAGFDELLSAEVAHDPFIPLAFAAVATERVRLGTGIAVAFPRSPMVVAHSAWDLHVQSGGRFSLGLGVQVKGHNERRFSVPWSPPVPRLREYVESLRAIWCCWEKGEPLAYEGEHYRFTLMTPEFSPRPSGLGPIPVAIAAVGPGMLRLAGRLCDGVRLHGFCSRRYLEEVVLPALEEGRARSGRRRERFEIWGGGFVVTGCDDAEVRRSFEETRYRIAFYGSTRTYAGVLGLHGWEELGVKLHRLSKEGRWEAMAAQVPDEVVHELAAVALHDDLPAAVEKRFGGLVDTLTLGLSGRTPAGRVREIVRELQRIPTRFAGPPADWT